MTVPVPPVPFVRLEVGLEALSPLLLEGALYVGAKLAVQRVFLQYGGAVAVLKALEIVEAYEDICTRRATRDMPSPKVGESLAAHVNGLD